AAAETGDPVGDIARLALNILFAPSVEDMVMPAGAGAKIEEGGFLGDPDQGIGAVAQDEEIAMITPTRRDHGFMDHLQPRHHPLRLLVIDGEEKGGAAGEGRNRPPGGNPQRAAVTADHAEET